MKNMHCLLLAVIVAIGGAFVQLSAQETEFFIPKGTELKSYVVANPTVANQEYWVTLVTLQGIVSKYSSEQIYYGGGNSLPVFSEALTNIYGLPKAVSDEITNMWDVIERYKSYIKGYVVYNGVNERNQATTLCGLLDGVAIDEKLLAPFQNKTGITNMLADVRGMSEKDIWQTYKAQLNPRFAAELDNEIPYHLRDYCAMAGMFVFSPNGTDPTFKLEVVRELGPMPGLFGYSEVLGGAEYDAFSHVQKEGVFHLGSNMAGNLSIMSSVRDPQMTIKRPAPVDPEEQVHYVTFMMSDGDNIAYNMWSQRFIWELPCRGEFNVGWGLMPSTVELAPAVLRSYYEEATEHDHFFAQGGVAGIYPSLWPKDSLIKHVQQVNRYMQAADMRVLQFIDEDNAWADTDNWEAGGLWDIYTSQPNISGMVFYNYGGPNTAEIRFSNGKPIVCLRDVLWDGITDSDKLAGIINSQAADPYSPQGYSAICVHVWSKDLDDIKSTIEQLNPNVRVVSPEDFINLIKTNVHLETDGPYGETVPLVPCQLEAEDFDKGGDKVAYHVADQHVFENEYRPDELIDIHSNEDIVWVANLTSGSFVRYTVQAQTTRGYFLGLNVRSDNGAKIRVDVNGVLSVNNELSVPAGSDFVKLYFPKSLMLSSKKESVVCIYVEEGTADIDFLEFTTTKPSAIQSVVNAVDYLVYLEGSTLFVSSDANADKVEQIQITDMRGMSFKWACGSADTSCSIQLPFSAQGVYVVSLYTRHGVVMKKIISR